MLGPNDLCLCCGTIAHASFQELVEAAAAGGFKAVSIWPQHYEGARATGLSDSDMRLMLENYGLVISELDPLLTWFPGADKAPIQPAFNYSEEFFFRIADTLGARSLNVAYFLAHRIDTETAAQAFGGLCDRAAQHGLKVSLESLPWSGIPDVKSAMEIVQQADRPNGGINLDTWHHFRGGHRAEELLALPGKAVVATQFNDAAPITVDDMVHEALHGRLVPGEGAIDLIEIVRALDAIGCLAPIGIEVFSDDLNKLPPVEVARKVSGAMQAILAKARSTGNHQPSMSMSEGGSSRVL